MTRNLNLNKTMIILRGLPGSGKSTFAKLLEIMNGVGMDGSRRVIVCCADDYMVDKAGNYQFDPKKLGFAHQSCREKAEWCADNSVPTIVIANTNTKRDEFKDYEKIAEEHGYTVFVLTVNNMHGSKSVHNVPDESLQKMRDRFQHFL